MLAMGISLLWLLIYAIVFCAVIYLVMYGIDKFVSPIPERVQQAVWFIVLLLVIIAILTALGGGGTGVPHPAFRF